MKFKATYLVHTPTGAEPCCAKHAEQLQYLMEAMGAHVNFAVPTKDMQCRNCINEDQTNQQKRRTER